jgi:hypothetical protein
MRGRFILPFFIILLTSLSPVLSQVSVSEVMEEIAGTDTLITIQIPQKDAAKHPEILMSRDQALQYLQKNRQLQSGKSFRDPLGSAIRHLIIEATNLPYDSAKNILQKFLSDSVSVTMDEFTLKTPVQVIVPEDTITAADTGLYAIKKDTVVIPGYSGHVDSLKAAVGVLLDYLESRDSSIIRFTGISNKEYSLWLNSKTDNMIRFWLKNDLDDSVTVWIGNPERNTIGLYLEHGVSFRRPAMQGNISDPRIEYQTQDNSNLVNIRKIITKSQFWRYHTEASFALNQGLLTNWVKGGENNVSTAFDVTWYADYTNKPRLISSNHFARIKFGLIKQGEEKIRKNLDLLETNSKFNHKAFGKFDFSAIMLLKTQVSKGYAYPNDSVPVSKFINPVTLTLGIGLDYKPNKVTSINFSPLSYKATFVPDTAAIDQTKYGIAADRRSKHEPGASFIISNEFKPFKTVSVTNRLQLFTNYINNPLNIDVDWEMILKASLNWFTELRLNTHLIFDDDTRTPVFDKDKNPVMGDDGVQKKTARIQFKELLGLSFVFRF